MKIHCGSGTVYLRNYINIDLPSSRCFLADERPDLVEKYITDETNYYGKHKTQSLNRFRAGPIVSEYVCDRFGSYFNLPCRDHEVEEFLARQSFEHLSLTEAREALIEIKRVLKNKSILRLDVPDHETTLEQLRTTQDSFHIRHLLGPRNSDYGFHLMSYTLQSLRTLVEEYGFEFLNEEKNIHLYPSITGRWVNND